MGKAIILEPMSTENGHKHGQSWGQKYTKLFQSYPTICNLVDYSPPGSSVHRILQKRILEWVAISFSRGSFWLRDWTGISYISCTGMWIVLYRSHLGSPALSIYYPKGWWKIVFMVNWRESDGSLFILFLDKKLIFYISTILSNTQEVKLIILYVWCCSQQFHIH